MSSRRLDFNMDSETVAASQADQVLGQTGGVGDIIERLVITVATSATGTVSIKNGSAGASIPITAANTPIGVYSVDIGAICTASGGWLVTTGAGASVLAVGKFK